jgi:hypothetical protein
LSESETFILQKDDSLVAQSSEIEEEESEDEIRDE